MKDLGRESDFIAPALPHQPAAAAQLLEDLVRTHPHSAVVGSSLGGYYATYLAEKFALPAVLINPAVRPYELLVEALGRQKNYRSGEEYDFTEQHIEQLRTLEVDAITPSRYFLMVETADEVLDYRSAVERYRDARHLIVEGGDHGFQSFAVHLDAALKFCGVPIP